MILAFETSTQILEIPEVVCQEAWQQSQSITPAGHRWQVYLNQICLQSILSWLQEKSGQHASIQLGQADFWAIVNGSTVMLGDDRIVLIPIETSDRTEFRVPQEWIDIPEWVGDYYLAIEVDADEQLLHIWGYTTHQALKTQGRYETDDRTYCLASKDLIQDMTVFWVMQQLEPELTRAPVAALPELSEIQVENLSQRLRSKVIPRLEVPFAQWGALLQQGWLRPRNAVNLSQWLNNIVETGWQTLESLISSEPELGFNFRSDATEVGIRRVKRLQFDSTPDVLLVVTLTVEADDRRRIWVQLLPQAPEIILPENMQLSLVSETEEVLQSARSGSASNYIQLRPFRCAIETQFQLEVTIADRRIVEAFVS